MKGLKEIRKEISQRWTEPGFLDKLLTRKFYKKEVAPVFCPEIYQKIVPEIEGFFELLNWDIIADPPTPII